MTRLQKLYQMRDILNEVIIYHENRKANEQSVYEQAKANGHCTHSKQCKNKIVPTRTMCAYHLRKAAERSTKYGRNKK